jgi:catechol 2,3-dioxygenase-like lactoylglutathione lyase family enzyme
LTPQPAPPLPALAINLVGLTVPDIHAAIDWYGAVFGFRCIMGLRVLQATEHTESGGVFGSGFRPAWQAHPLTGNYVGIELFPHWASAGSTRKVNI